VELFHNPNELAAAACLGMFVGKAGDIAEHLDIFRDLPANPRPLDLHGDGTPIVNYRPLKEAACPPFPRVLAK